MKKNKGFFLAETIIVLAVVTTAIAFVLPNVTKVYENYKNTSKYYDQTKDIYALKAMSEILEVEINEMTKDVASKLGCKDFGNGFSDNIISAFVPPAAGTLELQELYIANYLGNLSYTSNYEFNKYLSRLKKTSYDKNSYRLIGVFDDGSGEKRYASIKYQNPGTEKCD